MKDDTLSKATILVGFAALAVGNISAYRNPATGYELSTYTTTPLVFWIGISVALLVSVLAVFFGPSERPKLAGGFLGGLAMTAIVSLPLVRGYHYLGSQDSLSHLGTAVDMNAGLLLPTESRYPAVHTLGSVLHDAAGLPIRQTMMLLIIVFTVAFFVFVPLTVRRLTGDSVATSIALFSGFLLLPLNHLSPSISIDPTSQALMYAPALLFVFFTLYGRQTGRMSLLFLITSSFYVLLHPQQAANLVAFFGVIAAVQIVSDLADRDRPTSYGKWVLPEVTVYAATFLLWARNHEAFWNALEAVYLIPFTDTTVAESTATRSVSLTVVGGSLPEVFFKLFFVSLLFALLTCLLLFSELFRERAELLASDVRKTMTPDGGMLGPDLEHVFYGLFAIGGIFLLYFVGGISDQYFRHLGMLMVFGSILGSIALGLVFRRLSERYSLTVGRRAIVGFLLFCLVLSVPVVFASPYIYDSSDHVTEMQMSGYETTFEHRSETVMFEDIRSDTTRYGDVIEGKDVPAEEYHRRGEANVPDHFADRNLPAFYDEPTYVPVPEADRKRDAVLWNGFRFGSGDFAYLDSDAEIDRVQANGGYELYLVNE